MSELKQFDSVRLAAVLEPLRLQQAQLCVRAAAHDAVEAAKQLRASIKPLVLQNKGTSCRLVWWPAWPQPGFLVALRSAGNSLGCKRAHLAQVVWHHQQRGR